jgi:hypothetical protein
VQAFGSDRVHSNEEGRILLSCRMAKGWQPRTEKTSTSAEHPGTAVLWCDKYYEVVDIKPLAGSAVRYVLAPWRDEHVMRITDRYDEESEALRLSEHRAALRREKQRTSANVLAVFMGHLPAVVQEQLASELGVNAPRLTIASAIPPLIAFVVCLHFTVSAVIQHKPSPVPMWVWMVVAYLTFDAIFRAHTAWIQNRPMGSLPGLVVYAIYYFVARDGKIVSPFKPADGSSVKYTEPSAEESLHDAFIVREPFLTLLTPREQSRLLERFDYDYRTHSRQVAIVIIIFSLAGATTSLYSLFDRPRLGALISLVIACGLAFEQFRRIRAFERGPAGSVLAPFVRPFVRKLLI